MRIRKSTYINSKGKKTYRTTVSRKDLFGIRHSTTYVETEEDRKRRTQINPQAAVALILIIVFLTGVSLIQIGYNMESALICFTGAFFCFLMGLYYISKKFNITKKRYIFAAVCLFIGFATIITSAHDFGLTFAAVCVGLVFIAPSIIMGVLAYKQIKADKDSGLYYAIKDLKALLKNANIKDQTDYINAVSDLYSKPENTAQYTSKLKMLYLIMPLEYKQQFEDYINTHFSDYAVVIL